MKALHRKGVLEVLTVLCVLFSSAAGAQEQPNHEEAEKDVSRGLRDSELQQTITHPVGDLNYIRDPFERFVPVEPDVGTLTSGGRVLSLEALIAETHADDLVLVGSLFYRSRRWALFQTVHGKTYRVGETQVASEGGARVDFLDATSVTLSIPVFDESGNSYLRERTLSMRYR